MLKVTILIAIIIFIVVYAKTGKDTNPNDTPKSMYPITINNIEYFGGFEDIGYSKCLINLFEDKLTIGMLSTGITRTINYSNIVDVKPVSETQIKQVPSLSKIALVGAIGLLGKGKEKHVSVDYAVIVTRDKNILLKHENRDVIVSRINSQVKMYKSI